jgi:hypothetical protein
MKNGNYVGPRGGSCGHRMPDFFATRETTSFQSKVLLGVPSQALLPAGKEAWTVFYSDGGEKIRSGRRHSKKSGMTTNGEFGNILETVMDDAAIGDLVWNRWEKGSEELLAVYRFAITKRRNSHYSVTHFPRPTRAKLRSIRLMDPSVESSLKHY